VRLASTAARRIALTKSVGRIVLCAEEFFRHHRRDRISVARLSAAAGVSERRLRSAFHDVYSTSPKRYLTLWHLHQVRRALQSDPAITTVTDAATEHGFFELGRFAGAYRSVFGEPPSETLHRARHRDALARAEFA